MVVPAMRPAVWLWLKFSTLFMPRNSWLRCAAFGESQWMRAACAQMAVRTPVWTSIWRPMTAQACLLLRPRRRRQNSMKGMQKASRR